MAARKTTTRKNTGPTATEKLYKSAQEVIELTAQDLLDISKVAAMFPQYTGRNPMLIWKACRAAGRSVDSISELRTFAGWLAVGRVVKTGEHSFISIFQPNTHKNEDTGAIELSRCKALPLFDISQTDIKEQAPKAPALHVALDPHEIMRDASVAQLYTPGPRLFR